MKFWHWMNYTVLNHTHAYTHILLSFCLSVSLPLSLYIYTYTICYIYVYKYIPNFIFVKEGRVFVNGAGNRGSIPGRVRPKTQKWYLMPPSLSIIRYRSRGSRAIQRLELHLPLHFGEVAIEKGEVVCVSYGVNTLEQGVNTLILPSDMDNL